MRHLNFLLPLLLITLPACQPLATTPLQIPPLIAAAPDKVQLMTLPASDANICFPQAPVWVRRTDGIINVPDAYRYENRRLDTAYGLILFIDNHHTGYCDATGKIVIPARFDGGESFKEGIAAVQINGKYGYIDRFGNWLVPPTLDYAYGFWFGVGLAQSNGRYGLIDHAGQWVKPPTFSDASILSGGIQAQTPDGEEGFIDSQGNFLKTGPYAEYYQAPVPKK